MTIVNDPFSDGDFVDRFMQRRDEEDSVNLSVDEPAILGLVRKLRPSRAMELGCATGALTASLAELCGSVTAVDGSDAMLERAKAYCLAKNVTFVKSRFEDLRPTGDFDLVVSSMSLHLVEDFSTIASLVFGCLAPGGRFIFSQRHPIRTAHPTGEIAVGDRSGWVVLDYFDVGRRSYNWLGYEVTYFLRTVSDLITGLISAGFTLRGLTEPTPTYSELTKRTVENLNSPSVLLIEAEKSSG